MLSGNVVIVQQPGQTSNLKTSTSGTVMGSKEFVSFIQKHGAAPVDKVTIPTTVKALPTSPVSLNIKVGSLYIDCDLFCFLRRDNYDL